MRIITYSQAEKFLERVQPFLEAQEASNSLILGIAIRLREQPNWELIPPYMAAVESDAGDLLLVAVITPPHNLLIAGVDNAPEEALAALAGNLRGGNWPVPGVNGDGELSKRFAEIWTRLKPVRAEVHLRMRLYELRQVIPPPNPPPGFLRQATPADEALMVQWQEAFMLESLHEAPSRDTARVVANQIQAGYFYIWEDGRPVSCAISTRPTPHGISIGGVYTPPELRGRGYASALVAGLSQALLDSGKDYCALFTDLDYPTSNSIYQKIGYRPLRDFLEHRFIPAG